LRESWIVISAIRNSQSEIRNSKFFMAINITELNHVNVTVPRSLEERAKRFYGSVLGLREVPKPESSRGRGGAWYQLNDIQLHLSLEDATDANTSRRHICLIVADLAAAKRHLEEAGVEVFPDDIPTPGWPRFYVRDPGGNRIEIAEPE
jgi:catechol 2,3-dioxygenase-like lactoylglutathione lyase family enzyme